MRISARDACVKPHLRTRSDIYIGINALRRKGVEARRNYNLEGTAFH